MLIYKKHNGVIWFPLNWHELSSLNKVFIIIIIIIIIIIVIVIVIVIVIIIIIIIIIIDPVCFRRVLPVRCISAAWSFLYIFLKPNAVLSKEDVN